MLLTSFERIRRYLADEGGDNLSSSVQTKRDLSVWMPSVSNKIENYLNRELLIKARTEYFDINYADLQFWINAPPVTTLTTVKIDSSGQFDGGESTLVSGSDYYLSNKNDAIVLSNPESYTGFRNVQIIYTGGLAYHGTRSTFVIVTAGGSWTAGKYMVGSSSLAVGLIITASNTAPVVEILYGVFEVAETLTEYTSEDQSDATGITATLTSKTITALCESYPAIVEACEMEIRYLRKYKDSYENTGITKDGTTVRRDSREKKRLRLQPEVIDMIDPFRRISL